MKAFMRSFADLLSFQPRKFPGYALLFRLRYVRIGHRKENLIFFLNVLEEKIAVETCMRYKLTRGAIDTLSIAVERVRHPANMLAARVMFGQHHPNGSSFARYPHRLHGRKEYRLFFRMMASVGKHAKELDHVAEVVGAYRFTGKQTCARALQNAQHRLDGVMFTDQFFGWFHSCISM